MLDRLEGWLRAKTPSPKQYRIVQRHGYDVWDRGLARTLDDPDMTLLLAVRRIPRRERRGWLHLLNASGETVARRKVG